MADGNGSVDPQRLSIEQAAKLLSAAVKLQIPAEQIRQDVDQGAPRNGDGTINLVHYAAWQVKELGRGD